MRLLTSQELSYRPNGGHGQPGTCWLRLYTGPGGQRVLKSNARAVAVVTELNTNPGPSVTNAAESIRETILKLLFSYGFRLVPDGIDLTVYEHYNDLISYGHSATDLRFRGDRYARAGVDDHGKAIFAHATDGEVLEAVGDAGLVDLPAARGMLK